MALCHPVEERLEPEHEVASPHQPTPHESVFQTAKQTEPVRESNPYGLLSLSPTTICAGTLSSKRVFT